MSATTDVARAIFDKFAATGALTAAVPGGLTSDRERQPADGSVLESPYGILTVLKVRDRIEDTCGDYIDFRLAVVEIFGADKDTLGSIVSLLHDTYSNKTDLNFAFNSRVKAHMRTEVVDEEDAILEGRRQGFDFRQVSAAWIIWTHRSGG